MNIQAIKTRLARFLGNDLSRYDIILTHILYANEYPIPKIALTTAKAPTSVRKSLGEVLSISDYSAWEYAVCSDRSDEWQDLGEAFVRSLPQITESDVKHYAPFIVECMRWGEAKI